ncbi:MAG: hypothetical protein ACI9WU_001329 [Myxococcota bacterium]|jgi:hypothetical protein
MRDVIFDFATLLVMSASWMSLAILAGTMQ